MQHSTFHISGTHCPSCKILIEDVLSDEAGITQPLIDLKKETLSLQSENTDQIALIDRLNTTLKPLGYTLSEEKIKHPGINTEILWSALPIGLTFLLGFFILQKSGILSFGIGGNITPITSFLIGLVASVSSCLAIIGGLVLSLSAKVSHDNAKKSKKSIFLFHVGRIVGFTFLGGLLGLLGKSLGVSFTFSALLGIASSLIMITLGLNLVGILRKNTLTLPTGIFAWFQRADGTALAPILIGISTFFLPCGFTQSMQVAALASGSFLSGSLIMLAFSIGTLPILALLSVSSIEFSKSRHAPLFFASAGVIVIGLGLFALIAGLSGLGMIPPIFNI